MFYFNFREDYEPFIPSLSTVSYLKEDIVTSVSSNSFYELIFVDGVMRKELNIVIEESLTNISVYSIGAGAVILKEEPRLIDELVEIRRVVVSDMTDDIRDRFLSEWSLRFKNTIFENIEFFSDITNGLRSLEEKVAKSAKKAVQIAGIGMATEIMEEKKRSQMYMLEAGKIAAKKAYEEAKIKAKDIDLAEVHDCFAINQILTTEALGLSEDGKAGYDYMEGRFTRDDKVAVNISGGLKAKGHPVGATGASMHALLFKQLVGEPIGATLTKKKPEVGVVFNVGGSGVSNFITVLKRVK